MGEHLEVKTLFENGVVFYGMTDEEVFTEAALWLCNTFTDLEKVNNRITYHIESSGEDKDEMLSSFLGRILENINEHGMVFMEFYTRFFDVRGHGVETWAYGEPFMPKHLLKDKIVVGIKESKNRKFRELIDPSKFEHYTSSAEVEIVYGERKE